MHGAAQAEHVRNRLVLLIFVITAAAVGFVYLYVVPQLESSLTAEKLTRLEEQSAASSRLSSTVPSRSGLAQAEVTDLVRQIAQRTDSRVTLLGVAPGSPTAAQLRDRRLRGRADGDAARRYDVAVRAAESGQTSRGRACRRRSAPASAACRFPRRSCPSWVAVLSSPLDEVGDNVALIKRQILIAGGIALAAGADRRLLGGPGLLAPARAARRQAAEQVAEGDFTPADPGRLRGRARPAGADLQRDAAAPRATSTAPARSSSPTPRTSCARRSSRSAASSSCSRTRTPSPRSASEFVRDDARADRAADEADHRPARPLAARRRRDGARRPGRRPRSSSRARSPREFRPAAEAAQLAARSCARPTTRWSRAADPGRVRADHPYPARQCPHPHPEGTKVTVTAVAAPKGSARVVVSDEGRASSGATRARLRALLHRRLGRRLGARPGDRRELADADGRATSRSSPSAASPPSPCACRGARNKGEGQDVRFGSPRAHRGVLRRAHRPRRLRRTTRPAPTRTTTAETTGTASGADEAVIQASKGFSPEAIYKRDSPGVVTILSIFSSSGSDLLGGAGPARAPASSSTRTARSSPTPTSSPAAKAPRPAAGRSRRRRRSTSSSPTATRSPAEIVGFDPTPTSRCSRSTPTASTSTRSSSADGERRPVGEPVAAIGSPFGEEQSLSVGVVSATDRTIESLTEFPIDGAIQTDAVDQPRQLRRAAARRRRAR